MEATILSPAKKKAKERNKKIWRDFKYYYRPEDKNRMAVIGRIAVDVGIDPQVCWRIVKKKEKEEAIKEKEVVTH